MKRLTTLVLSLLALVVLAQGDGGDVKKFKATWGAAFEVGKKYDDWGYIGNMTDGIVHVSIRDQKDMVLQRFDPNRLTLTKKTEIDLSKYPKGYYVESFVRMDEKQFMLYAVWDKAREKEQLYKQEIDLKTGTLKGKGELMIESDKLAGTSVSTGLYKLQTQDKFGIEISKKRDMMLVRYRRIPEHRDDAINKDVIGYFVFDSDLNKIWGKEFTMPYTEEKMDNIDYTIDPNGTVFMLAKVYPYGRKESKDDKPNYHFEMLVFGPEGAMGKVPVKLENRYVKSILISETFAGDIICTGYYSSDYKRPNADGVFLFKYSPNGELVKLKKGYYEFPVEVMKMFEKARDQKKMEKKEEKGKAEEDYLQFRQVLLNEYDNSIVVNGEDYHSVTTTRTTSNGTYTTTTYYYDDIYAMRINGDGELAWVNKIPKRQEGKTSGTYVVNGRGGMSYKFFSYQGNNYYFYLDNIKNLNLPAEQAPAKHINKQGGFLTISKIDETGNQSKGKLFDLRAEEVNIQPADFDVIDDVYLLGRSIDGKNSKLLKVTYTP